MTRGKVSMVFILTFTFSMLIYLVIDSNSYTTIEIENLGLNSLTANEGKTDINIATYEQLCEIKGIGDALANRILDARKKCGGFSSMFDVDEIEGIGQSKLEALSEKFYVSN